MAAIAEIKYVDSFQFLSSCDQTFLSKMPNISHLNHETEIHTVTLLKRTVAGYYKTARIGPSCPRVHAQPGKDHSANYNEI